MELRLRKTKVGGENWRSAIVPFRVDGGIDVMESYMRDALASSLISKNGAWYTYKEQRAQGMNGLKALLKEHPSLYDTLVSELEQTNAT